MPFGATAFEGGVYGRDIKAGVEISRGLEVGRKQVQ